jgi:hypothetical protein
MGFILGLHLRKPLLWLQAQGYVATLVVNLQNQPQKTKWIERINLGNCLKVLG